MLKALAAGLLLILSAHACAETVRFATLNTWWLFDDVVPHTRWAGQRVGQTYLDKLDKVAQAIQEIDAHVIGLQEIEGPKVLQDLNEKLDSLGAGYPYLWVGQGTESFTGQDVAILSHFPPLIEPVLRYPGLTEPFYAEQGGYPRVAALQKFMRVDVEISDESVSVFVAHLKSQRGGEGAEEERLAQARVVRRIVRAVAEKGEPNVVLMGDMNDDHGTATLLTLRGLTDGSYPFSQPSDRIAPDDRWTHDFNGNKEQLDHILLNKFMNDRVIDAKIVRFGDEVSDHDAFVVDVDFD